MSTQSLFLPSDQHGYEDIRRFIMAHKGGKDRSRPWMDGSFSIDAFINSDEPAGLFRVIGYSMDLLVLGNGRCAMIEDTALDTKIANVVRVINDPDPIGLVRKASQMGREGRYRLHHTVIDPSKDTGDYDVRGLAYSDVVLEPLLLSKGALALPFAPGDRTVDEDQTALMQAIDDWGQGLNNPFFLYPDDEQGWNDEQQNDLVSITTDTLLALGFEATAVVQSRDPDGGEAITLTDDETGDSLDEESRVVWLLSKTLPIEAFQGHAWEYNDGAHTRVSGYYQAPITIATLDLESGISQHERIAARQRTQERVAAHAPDLMAAFFDVDQPFP